MKQLFGSGASVIAGACCLGFAPLLAGLSAIGAGFLINDAILIPLFVAALGFTVWNLARSRRVHHLNGPLILGIVGSLVAFVALWFFTPAAYAGLAALVVASGWDFLSKSKVGRVAPSA